MNPPLQFLDQEYLAKLRSLPNMINHIHWDGSIPAADLFALAQRKGRELLLPGKDSAGNQIMYSSQESRVIDSIEKLRQFQQGLFRQYSIISVFAVPISFMQTREDLIAMAIAHCRDLQSQNTVYAESRFAPQYHRFEGLSLSQVIGYALEGFEQGKEETGVIVNPVICIGREAEPDFGEAVVDAALEFKNRNIIGIDIACDEHGNPPEKHYKAFQKTFDSNLKRTVHADEMVSEEEGLRNIYTSITQLKVNAIAHGIHLPSRLYRGKIDLVELMVRHGIRYEANPISNYTCGFIKNIADLQLDKLDRDGVLVTVNPDDPAMWNNGDLAHNLYVVGKLYGHDFVKKVLQNAAKTAWGISGEEKIVQLARLDEAWDKTWNWTS